MVGRWAAALRVVALFEKGLRQASRLASDDSGARCFVPNMSLSLRATVARSIDRLRAHAHMQHIRTDWLMVAF